MAEKKSQSSPELYFQFFTEIGILEQLGRNMFEARLPDGFLISHFTVLNHLVRVKDGRTPLELAKAFQVPKTTMTHTLAILLRHHMVRSADNPQDGRSKCIWITSEGRAFREHAIASIVPDFETVAAHYPVSKIAPLLPTLQELRRVMDMLRDRT
jgi:DNA-binding MarR family transcriptional regulator